MYLICFQPTGNSHALFGRNGVHPDQIAKMCWLIQVLNSFVRDFVCVGHFDPLDMTCMDVSKQCRTRSAITSVLSDQDLPSSLVDLMLIWIYTVCICDKTRVYRVKWEYVDVFVNIILHVLWTPYYCDTIITAVPLSFDNK